MLELVERHITGKARLLRLLDEIAQSGWCEKTLYLTPASLARRADDSRNARHVGECDEPTRIVIRTVEKSDTGVAVFIGQGRAVAICPPFPLRADARHDGAAASPLLRLLDTEYTVGIVLLRPWQIRRRRPARRPPSSIQDRHALHEKTATAPAASPSAASSAAASA